MTKKRLYDEIKSNISGLILFAISCLLSPVISYGDTYFASTPSAIQSYTDILQAGDTLLVQEGTYNMNWNIEDRYGTSTDRIVIVAINNNAIINGIAYENVINIYNCHYVEFRGFEITNTYAASGIDGIKFKTTSDHFLMEDFDIHNITGVGISANNANNTFSYIAVRHCHIHDISDVGEGIYFGNHEGLAPVHHCLVELNWIHDCHPHKGIQFKRGTYLNIIQDNVIYDCDEAGIVLYKTDQVSATDNNVVRRNVIWNTTEGIFAVGQTNIDNNVIFNCEYGINVRNYGGWGMQDLYIRNNTSYYCNITCLRIDDWNNATGEMVCINNACYQDDISQDAIQSPEGIGPGIVAYNQHYGQSEVSGSTLGNPPEQTFINSSIAPGIVDLYPKNNSSLRDAGTQDYQVSDEDFNLFPRPYAGVWDVGAYEWSGITNPGWQIDEGFKEISISVSETKPVPARGEHICTSIGKTISWRNLDPGDAIKIYEISGKLIHNSGLIFSHDYKWNARNFASGLYFYVIKARTGVILCTGKVVVIK